MGVALMFVGDDDVTATPAVAGSQMNVQWGTRVDRHPRRSPNFVGILQSLCQGRCANCHTAHDQSLVPKERLGK